MMIAATNKYIVHTKGLDRETLKTSVREKVATARGEKDILKTNICGHRRSTGRVRSVVCVPADERQEHKGKQWSER